MQNHAEDSPVRETLTSTMHDRVFWCAPEDAQKLLNELYSKNVEQFMTNTRLDDTMLTLRSMNRLSR